MEWGKLFERVTSDGHLPCGLFVFIIGSVIQWVHRLDPSFVAFTTTVLGFLGGHAWIQSKQPDPPLGPHA
jgi:hypothetical protein